MKEQILIVYLIVFNSGLISSAAKLNKPNDQIVLEFKFPLKIYDRLPVEGRVIDLIRTSGNHLIWLNESGKITAYDCLKKEIIWTFESSQTNLTRLYSLGKIVLCADNQNYLLALSHEGKPLWPQPFRQFGGHLVSYEEKAFISSIDRKVLAIEPFTGEIIWSKDMNEDIEGLVALPQRGIIAILSSGLIFQLFFDGSEVKLGQVGQKIWPYASGRGEYLFLGTRDKGLICWHLQKRKRLWWMKLAGQLVTEPLPFGRNLYVITSNAVLYCLSQRSGEIKWWRAIPSRLAYKLLAVDPYIIVTTPNPPLLAFDLNTGQKIGEFNPETGISASPFLLDNKLIVATYDSINEAGSLLFLEPDIRITLSSSLPSPQQVGTEIIFTAEVVGFDEPRFEFFLQIGEKRTIVQRESSRNNWTWLPLAPGDYVVGVKVKDKRKSQEAVVTFQVVKEPHLN
ncbi:MAG: PQQ-like beta-propeller repeat protein [Candidatus Aminicenantes bacterium]|nr:PQQ-like beta-propeller repeat protein [Candidatus Aminicenantes bacterium]